MLRLTKIFSLISFYFYNNPELAIPICAIDKQEVEIVIKLRERGDCVWGYIALQPDYIYYLADYVRTKGLIKDMKITTEMVSLDSEERAKLKSEKIDYTITQIQEYKDIIPQDPDISSLVNTTHRLNFTNPVKELFFIFKE